MNKEERDREKELKYLIYLRNEIIKQAKKDLKSYREELDRLGKEGDHEKGNRLVRKRKRNN